jgi:hypothetical protein
MNDEVRQMRKRARTRREWVEISRNINDLTEYEKMVVEYALRKRDDFPRPEYEVKRVVEATINVQGQTSAPPPTAWGARGGNPLTGK